MNDGWHNLSVAILLQAARDTGRCGTRPCRPSCRKKGPYCDLGRFWRSTWAEQLCGEVGLDYHAVLARSQELARTRKRRVLR